MTWHYEYPSTEATHEPTGARFSIAYDKTSATWSIKLSSKPEPTSDTDIESLREELDSLITDEHTRHEFSRLLSEGLQRNVSRASLVLSSETGRKVSTRTIQAWLMHRTRPSSRRCPSWAVKALRDFISREPILPPYTETPEHHDYMRNPKPIIDGTELADAERYLNYVSNIHERWESVKIGDMPQKVAEFELDIRDQIDDINAINNILITIVRENMNGEDAAKRLERDLERHYCRKREVRNTARDISEKRAEFASDYGVQS